MSRIITQETFNDVVNENVEEFEMSVDEAIEEAVKQFQAQGVNLSNIIMKTSSAAAITRAVKSLEACLAKESDEDVCRELGVLRLEMDKELPLRVHASKEGLYLLLMESLGKLDPQHQGEAVNTLASLMNGYPDLFEQQGLRHMAKLLETSTDPELVVQVLRWAGICVTKHEKNRSDLVASSIPAALNSLLQRHLSHARVLIHVCQLVRRLVCDDDVRVVHGNAHEHARTLARETLATFTEYMHRFCSDADVLVEVLSVVCTLIVREELCMAVYEDDGVKYILDAMVTHTDHRKINHHSLSLLKGLAGSDKVKDAIIEQGAASLVISAVQRHQASASLVSAGCVCISALSLRSPTNSRALVTAGAPDLLVQVLTRWMDNPSILGHACSAIRNQVSRCPELRDEYLQLGVEDILNDVMSAEGSLQFEAKGVLRDLGCAVKLEEQWRGQGQQLTN